MKIPLKVEQWLYLFFVVTLPFATLPELAGYTGNVQIADVVLLVTGVVWFVLWVARKRSIVWSHAYIFLAAYALAVTLSAIFSIRPEQSAVKLVGKFYLFAIVFLTINIITSLNDLKNLVRAWLVGSGLVILLSLAGIAAFYLGVTDPGKNLVLHPIFGSLPPGSYPRIEGFFNYPSLLCNYLSITAAFLVLAASVTLFSYSTEGTRLPIARGEISRSHRAEAWRTAFQSFLKSPILGRGIDVPVADSRFIDPSGNSQLLTDAHNTYLSVLAETGLAGFVTFAALIGFLLIRIWSMMPSARPVAIICFISIADVFFYQGLTGSYEDTRHIWLLFGSIFALSGLLGSRWPE